LKRYNIKFLFKINSDSYKRKFEEIGRNLKNSY
jgi:hypothetical protein